MNQLTIKQIQEKRKNKPLKQRIEETNTKLKAKELVRKIKLSRKWR